MKSELGGRLDGRERRALQLFIETTATCDTQSADELLELDRAASVGIEDLEDMSGEVFRIAEGEELFVYRCKVLFVEAARGAVLLEALVPLLELSLVDWRGLSREQRQNIKTDNR